MKATLFKGLLFLLPFIGLQAHEKRRGLPDDQLLVIFGSSGYVLYKVLDFANDHGFRYIKVLSYEFSGFEHTIIGRCNIDGKNKEGRFFELRDENATITFFCYEEAPDDIYVIDLEKYRSLLEEVELDSDAS